MILRLQDCTMQDECAEFFGWRENSFHSNKLKSYKKLISSIENELKIADVLKDMKSICSDLIEDTSLKVAINNLPSFTMYLRKGAEFVSEFAYDSEDDLSDDYINDADETSAIDRLSEGWNSDSELVDSNSVISEINCISHSLVDMNSQGTSLETAIPKMNCTNHSSEELDSQASNVDDSKELCVEEPMLYNNSKLAKQPVVRLTPLNMSNIPEFMTRNINNNGDTSQVVRPNFTTDTTELVLDDHRTNGSESNIYTSKKEAQGILRQEYPESTSEILTTDVLIERHISKKPRSTFDIKSKTEFLKIIRKTADDSQIVSKLERNFICNYCGKAFLEKSSLRKHILICSIRDDGAVYVKPPKKTVQKDSYECKLCQTTYKTKFNLLRHSTNTHNLKRSFRCVVCAWSFFNETELQRHCTIRHGLSGSKAFKCPYCKESFSRRGDIQYHCRTKHGGKKLYFCSICIKSFKDQSVYNLHKQNHGTKCEVCTFSSKSENEMAAHRASHLELITYRCEICSRTFQKRGPFTKHIQFHEKEKRF